MLKHNGVDGAPMARTSRPASKNSLTRNGRRSTKPVMRTEYRPRPRIFARVWIWFPLPFDKGERGIRLGAPDACVFTRERDRCSLSPATPGDYGLSLLRRVA